MSSAVRPDSSTDGLPGSLNEMNSQPNSIEITLLYLRLNAFCVCLLLPSKRARERERLSVGRMLAADRIRRAENAAAHNTYDRLDFS